VHKQIRFTTAQWCVLPMQHAACCKRNAFFNYRKAKGYSCWRVLWN